MTSIEVLGQLVPGPAAAGIDCLASNNNLDLCRHENRWYLAWRTGRTHFASDRVRMHVSSTDALDGEWRHETTVDLGCDVREPRWVDAGDELHLFFMELGTNPRRFQPRRTHHLRRAGGAWERSEVPLAHGFVPWRIRRIRGRWAMLGYSGAEAMYSARAGDTTAQVRWSDDLEEWEPPVDLHRSGTEAELVELPDGRLLGVTRNEGPVRFGGDLLLGPELDQLSVRRLRRKPDSPNLFLWHGVPHLIARRQRAFRGRYDLAPAWLPGVARIRVDQGLWWVTRKRSALWRVDVARLDRDTAGRNGIVPADPALVHVADLPSRGDTSFGAVVVDDDGSLVVADYTTPESVGDVPWVRGQLNPTVIQLLRIRR